MLALPAIALWSSIPFEAAVSVRQRTLTCQQKQQRSIAWDRYVADAGLIAAISV
jgi:hypothetical protein